MDDLEMIRIITITIVNVMVSAGIILFFVIFMQPPDDSLAPLYVGVISFIVLGVIEFLCWLLHIPAWIGRGLSWIHEKTDWIHDKTEPKE